MEPDHLRFPQQADAVRENIEELNRRSKKAHMPAPAISPRIGPKLARGRVRREREPAGERGRGLCVLQGGHVPAESGTRHANRGV